MTLKRKILTAVLILATLVFLSSLYVIFTDKLDFLKWLAWTIVIGYGSSTVLTLLTFWNDYRKTIRRKK